MHFFYPKVGVSPKQRIAKSLARACGEMLWIVSHDHVDAVVRVAIVVCASVVCASVVHVLVPVVPDLAVSDVLKCCEIEANLTLLNLTFFAYV